MPMTSRQETVAEVLSRAIRHSGKTQRELAREMGYRNQNILTMFKQGITKLPLDKVAVVAKVLELDPAYLLRLVMEEYAPEAWTVIEKSLGQLVLSEEEKHLVLAYRKAGAGGARPSVAVTPGGWVR